LSRLEPNLLLAIATAIPLALLVMTAGAFGEPGQALKYALLAVTCSIGFVFLNGLMRRRTGRERQPMIRLETPGTAVWAGLFPLFLIFASAIPVFWPGHDYGLLVIIAAVLFGVTVESAMAARR
jgi:hypothetical protein